MIGVQGAEVGQPNSNPIIFAVLTERRNSIEYKIMQMS